MSDEILTKQKKALEELEEDLKKQRDVLEKFEPVLEEQEEMLKKKSGKICILNNWLLKT